MLQIARSILDSSSDPSSSEDDDILEILGSLDQIDDDGPPSPKRSRKDFHNKYFSDIHKSPYFSLDDFKTHFHISRISFEELLRAITNPAVSAGRPPIPPAESLLITIWTLSKQEPYRLISERFNISIGHCVRVFHFTCQKLFCMANKYIYWPTGEEALQVIDDFNNESELYNVFGAVGVTHLLIPASQTDLTYYDKKGNNSIILQAVCNSKQEFMNINVGCPGSFHYGHVWLNSAIYSKLRDDENFIPEGSYLVGDISYPLDEFLIVPFRDNEIDLENKKVVIVPREKRFNEILYDTRFVIQRAFGRLKGLFTRLKHLNIIKVDNIKYLVTTACMLHNLSIRDEVICNDFDLPYQDACELEPVFTTLYHSDAAHEFRRNLLDQLVPIDSIVGL